jgi:hypothetical protein
MIARCVFVIGLAGACGKAPEAQPATQPAQVAVPSATAETSNDELAVVASASIAPPPFTLERLPRSIKGPRVKELLVPEVQGLERLHALTPENAPDRPQLTRRLGIVTFELYLVFLAEGSETRPTLENAEKHLLATPPAAFERAPSDLYVLGIVQEQLGKLDAAAATYASVTRGGNTPADVLARAHFGLALIAELKKKTDEARRELVEAQTILASLALQTDQDQKLRAQIDEKLKAR